MKTLIPTPSKTEIAVGVTVASFTAGIAWYLNRRRSSSDDIPTDWLEVGTVKQLLVYPLKSGAAIVCNDFDCTDFGPISGHSRDRSLAVVNEEGKLLTGRDFPSLTQLKANVTDGGVATLSAEGFPDFSFSLHLPGSEATWKPFKIHKHQSEGVDCGDAAAQYISKYLSTKARLMYFPDEHRPGKPTDIGLRGLTYINRSKDAGIFADKMSYQIVNCQSVRDLNSRLANPVDARNFRPNIIVDGEKLVPYEEDHWEWIKIGDVVFRIVAPGTRCVFTTVNPDTGEKSKSMEPLKTLLRYRVLRDPAKKSLFGTSPVLGMLLGLRRSGNIKVGDPLYVSIKV